ncbi:G-type lectin S-receptor-like serine/threonine-protein kinase [Tanacetum coccineum]
MATGRGIAVNRLCMTCWYILIISLQHSRETDMLTKDNPIYIGKTLVLANQVFELGFFSPDNSAKQYLGIWLKNITIRKIIWVANRESPLSISDTSSSLTIVDDGNLRILDGERNTVWSTNITLQSNKTTVKLTDTGDFCLNDTVSGMIFDDDPTPENFVVGLSEERPPQIFTWNGSKPHWRGGPWDGGKFIGVPEQNPGYSELINLPDGMFQMIYLDDDNKMAWEEPNDPCDVYGVCSAFAFCTSNKSPTCDCLKGYLPESNEEWGRSYKRVKLPDHYLYFPNKDPDGCKEWCMDNCSCKAYAFVIGIYCMGWTEDLIDIEQFPFGGEDLYLRLSHSESDPKKRWQLDWPTRLNIIQGIGRGLIYLHRDSCLRIIHRDLKCSNILLDEKMNPKISDFGLARNFQMTQELANTRRIVGTYGYMSPEYAMGGVISEKSDVFSYGVMLLEIISGKRNTEFIHQEQVYPLARAWKSWKEGRGDEFIDQALAKPSCLPEGFRCLHVGLLCVQDLAKDRPTMTEVVNMLCSETDLPQPKEPLFTLQRLSGSSIGQESSNMRSINAVTMSIVEGR